MEEIIQQITQRAGIDESQARTAVETVVSFLKDKLPAPIGGQIENVLGGVGTASGGLADSAGDMLGGIFGKK